MAENPKIPAHPIPIAMEVIALHRQSEYRNVLGQVMGGGQLPAGERHFASPRFLAGMLAQTASEKDAGVDPDGLTPLLPRALKNCGTLPDAALDSMGREDFSAAARSLRLANRDSRGRGLEANCRGCLDPMGGWKNLRHGNYRFSDLYSYAGSLRAG